MKPPHSFIVQCKCIDCIVLYCTTSHDMLGVMELALPSAMLIAVNSFTDIEQAEPVPLIFESEHLGFIFFDSQISSVKTRDSSCLHWPKCMMGGNDLCGVEDDGDAPRGESLSTGRALRFYFGQKLF